MMNNEVEVDSVVPTPPAKKQKLQEFVDEFQAALEGEGQEAVIKTGSSGGGANASAEEKPQQQPTLTLKIRQATSRGRPNKLYDGLTNRFDTKEKREAIILCLGGNTDLTNKIIGCLEDCIYLDATKEMEEMKKKLLEYVTTSTSTLDVNGNGNDNDADRDGIVEKYLFGMLWILQQVVDIQYPKPKIFLLCLKHLWEVSHKSHKMSQEGRTRATRKKAHKFRNKYKEILNRANFLELILQIIILKDKCYEWRLVVGIFTLRRYHLGFMNFQLELPIVEELVKTTKLHTIGMMKQQHDDDEDSSSHSKFVIGATMTGLNSLWETYGMDCIFPEQAIYTSSEERAKYQQLLYLPEEKFQVLHTTFALILIYFDHSPIMLDVEYLLSQYVGYENNTDTPLASQILKQVLLDNPNYLQMLDWAVQHLGENLSEHLKKDSGAELSYQGLKKVAGKIHRLLEEEEEDEEDGDDDEDEEEDTDEDENEEEEEEDTGTDTELMIEDESL